jgi:hypothetical protein
MLIRRKKKIILLKRRKEEPKKRDVPAALYTDTPWYWRYIAGDSTICYSCDRKIIGAGALKTRVYIGKHPFNGARIYRHSHCHPLTVVWQKKFGDNEYFRNRVRKWKERREAKANSFDHVPIIVPNVNNGVLLNRRTKETKLMRRRK